MSDGLFAVVQDDITWLDNEENKDNSYNTGENLEDTVHQQELRSDNRNIHEPNECESMENLFKEYSNDDNRYSGVTKENLERKFILFFERYGEADIVEVDRNRAFSTLIAGSAL